MFIPDPGGFRSRVDLGLFFNNQKVKLGLECYSQVALGTSWGKFGKHDTKKKERRKAHNKGGVVC